MIRAFLYLYATSTANALRQRLRRLRQPKYLLGAIVGAAYFWFFVFRNMFRGAPRPGAAAHAPVDPAALTPFLEPVGALILLVVVAGVWLLGNRRAALQFTEPEAAFLFPAPVARRTLIHFKLLRSQLGILVSALFFTLVFRRSNLFAGNQLIHAAGWWVVFSILNLHFLGASFARERLLELGVNPGRRRLLVGGLILALALACWLSLRATLPAPSDADVASPAAFEAYARQVLATPPLSWLLFPFALVVRPYLAATPGAFLSALGPALLLLGAHYLWVVRSDVSFEEASLELAAKRAQRRAVLEGRASGRRLPTKPKPEPFPLAAAGFVPLAYLWKNLLALGPLFRLRTWLLACAVAAAGLLWLARQPDYAPLLKVAGAVALVSSIWILLFGPMFMRREIQQTLPQLDITKAYPLPGWQVVLGELLTPMVLLTFVQWFLLLVMVLALGSTTNDRWLVALLGAGGTAGIAVLAPPLTGLMLCIPFAGVLFFPAWAQAPAGSGAGIEIMGQRLIFMAGYLIVLVVALLPAAAAGAVVWIIVNWLLGQVAALTLTLLVAAAVLGGELAAAVWWLGDKLERFDLSTELPR